MARYFIEDTTLTGIADAIRDVTKTSDLISPNEMGERVRKIKPQIVLQEKEVDQNGVVESDAGFDGLSRVTVNVPNKDYIGIQKLLEFRGMSAEELFRDTGTVVTDTVESFDGVLDGISGIVSTKYMFTACKALKRAPLFDTSKVTDMSQMFNQCSVLETIPEYDIRSVKNIATFCANCPNLQEIFVRNIPISMTVSASTNSGHLLKVESLVHLIAELRNKGSLLTLTMGGINREKLADVYVKTVEITDEMREEDDLIDEKVPFVLCKSTDEGAMPITEYALAMKQWQIA